MKFSFVFGKFNCFHQNHQMILDSFKGLRDDRKFLWVSPNKKLELSWGWRMSTAYSYLNDPSINISGAPNPYEVLETTLLCHPEATEVTVVCGADRHKNYNSMLERLSTKFPWIKFQVLAVVNPYFVFHATEIRKLAKKGELGAYLEVLQDCTMLTHAQKLEQYDLLQ